MSPDIGQPVQSNDDIRSVPRLRWVRQRRVIIPESDEPLLSYLSPDQVALLRFEGTYQEAAATLNIPVGTVRSRLSRARAKLKELRKEQADGTLEPNLTSGRHT